MAEELKELLEKIRREGIEVAEEQARRIEAEARARGAAIVADASKEAGRMVADAEERIAKAEASMRRTLEQASRDTLIALRKEIGATLDRIVSAHVHHALSSDELTRVILALVKDAGSAGRERMVISLKKEDLERVEKALLGELGAEARKHIILKHAGDIKGGFTISYDSGKSYYDFTDRALAEYLAQALKPELGNILRESAGETK